MAGSNIDLLGSFMLERYSLKPFSKFLKNSPFISSSRPSSKRRLLVRKVVKTTPLAALTAEDLMMKNVTAKEPAVNTFKVAAPVEKDLGNLAMKDVAKEAVIVKVTALVTLRHGKKENMKEMMLHWLDSSTYPTQHSVVLQLVSTEIDPRTMEAKLSKEAVLDSTNSLKFGGEKVTLEVDFMVDSNFGMPGGITVSNKYPKEFFLESVTIEGVVHFACNSWVQPEKINAGKRIFFSNKAYLPPETPAGLRELREMELRELRGDGKGLRIQSDRIYDYDMYNDLGNPDKGIEYVRPILGGEKNPHPRRCRTGRAPTNTNVNSERPVDASMEMYVPRDEALGEAKKEAFFVGKLKGMLRNMIPSLKTSIFADGDVFQGFSDIEDLYKERTKSKDGFFKKLPLTKILSKTQQTIEEILKFDPPKIISRDTFCSLRDDEFGRQVIAGINPLNIERLEVFPPVSKLDASIYGSSESAIKEEHIISHLNGMSVQKAIEENKLFILDYHDIYLPFLNRINALDGRKAYGTRTLFYLTPMGTLKPIAIELSLPRADPNIPSKQVLTPPVDATTNWLWQLGKAHVCSNDAGVHQLVNHWLRTHACMEPFIIAAHRQLSAMHPIFKLLDPHMRYTLEINAQARETLINANGIIESFFTPAKYCMEISCAAYRDWWRFDLEGLPADLIRRGVAVPDPTQAHGLRLLIEDYPYATDGLLIWSAIETLVRTYVKHYYPNASLVQADTELQAWYHESINVGHADLRQASWWPKLSTPADLASILTNIIWLASAQHAAVNFGQYPYGGYVPNRPPLMRRLVPKDQDPDYANFVADPQGYFLSSLPSLFQATKFMAVIDIISAHSPDEEYIGERNDLSNWSGEREIIEAFYKFSMEIRRIEKEIEKRNGDPRLRNRCGAGISPYELLIPSSGPGVT